MNYYNSFIYFYVNFYNFYVKINTFIHQACFIGLCWFQLIEIFFLIQLTLLKRFLTELS